MVSSFFIINLKLSLLPISLTNIRFLIGTLNYPTVDCNVSGNEKKIPIISRKKKTQFTKNPIYQNHFRYRVDKYSGFVADVTYEQNKYEPKYEPVPDYMPRELPHDGPFKLNIFG